MSKKIEFGFRVKIQSIMEHNVSTKKTKLVAVESMLYPSEGLDEEKYLIKEGSGGMTKLGAEAMTATLVQELVGNIHQAHQFNQIDSAEHLRKIIGMLEDGFVANSEIKLGQSFTD